MKVVKEPAGRNGEAYREATSFAEPVGHLSSLKTKRQRLRDRCFWQSARVTSVMSANTMPALERGETGAYGELVKRPLPEGLSLVFKVGS